MDFDLAFTIFICVLFSQYWWLIPVFLFCLFIKRIFWGSPHDEIYAEKLKNEKEYEEKRKKEQLRLEEKELLEKAHPELCLSHDLRKREIRRLAFHEKTGHITKPEKELLEVLKASVI